MPYDLRVLVMHVLRILLELLETQDERRARQLASALDIPPAELEDNWPGDNV